MKFESICVQTGHDGIQNGQVSLVSDLLDEQYKEPEKKLAATDFDQTLTRDDIGALAFMESFLQKRFWDFSIKEFEELLAPTKPIPPNLLSYRDLVTKAANGNIKASSEVQKNSTRLLELFSSLKGLYGSLQKNPDNMVLQEVFAKEMLEFDEIVLPLEVFFSDFFGNQIFSRTRFLVGKSNLDTKKLSQNILKKGKVQLNDAVFSIFEELKKRGGEQRIVTTNLKSIVREIVKESVLGEVFSEDDVIATMLAKNGERRFESGKRSVDFSQYIEGEPVYGKRKVELLRQTSVNIDRRFNLAAGDSVGNDGPMMAESLKRDGIAIVVVPANTDIEKVAQSFEVKIQNELNKESLTEEEKQRMWYLQSNQFTDARELKCNH